MIISCSSLFLWEYNIDEIINIVLDSKIKSIEFWLETPAYWLKRNHKDSFQNLKKAISKLPDGCSIHAPILDLNSCSINENVREVTLKETLWSLEIAKKLNARTVTIHPGKRTVKRPPLKDDWNAFLKYLDVCCNKAKALDVCICLENNMPGISRLCSNIADMRYVLDMFPELFMTFDIVHSLMNSKDKAIDFIKYFNERIVNVHVSDLYNGKPHYPSRYNNGYVEKILVELKKLGYSGDITIELDDSVYPYSLSRKDKIKELCEEKKYISKMLRWGFEPQSQE